MSLLCQNCQEAKATVHITDTVPEKRERHLCESCAEKEGVIIKQHPPTSNEILQQFIKQKAGISPAEDLTCTRCGMSFREFHVKGQLGCPNDYEAFRTVLTALIEQAHEGATQHVGKIPVTADETMHRQAELFKLRRELKEAVEQENYEVAARVRDQIKAMDAE